MSKRNRDFIRLWVEPATKQVNNDLYPFVALGDEAAREKMIQSNIGLVMHYADQFIGCYPDLGHYRDDLIAEGMIGLVEAVNRMVATGFLDNACSTSLMALCIQQAIGEAAEGEATIRIPSTTFQRKRDEGIELHVPSRDYTVSADYADNLEIIEDWDDGEEPLPPAHSKATPNDPRQMGDIRRLIEAACENDTDHAIVRLRESGSVDREIAERLGLPLTTLYVMRQGIYARFLQLSGFKP